MQISSTLCSSTSTVLHAPKGLQSKVSSYQWTQQLGKQNQTAGEAEGSSEIIISEISWRIIPHQLIIHNIKCYLTLSVSGNSLCMLTIVLEILRIWTIVGCGNFHLLLLLSEILVIKGKAKEKILNTLPRHSRGRENLCLLEPRPFCV